MLNDFILVQKQTFSGMRKTVKYLPIILMVMAAGFLMINIALRIFVPLTPLIRGILLYLVELFAFSLVLNVLSLVVRKEKLNLLPWDASVRFIGTLMTLGFIDYLITQLMVTPNLLQAYVIARTLIFNPLPEVLYVRDEDALSSLKYTLIFWKDNAYNWIVPTALSFLLFYFLLFTPIENSMLRFVSVLILTAIIMLYRGHCFAALNNSNPRKRKFMGQF